VGSILLGSSARELRAGEWLYRQGERANRFFLLETGQIKIHRTTSEGREMLLRLAGPGEISGFSALLEHQCYNVSARAVCASRAAMWSADSIRQLVLRYPQLALNAYAVLFDSFVKFEERYRLLATEAVECRIATTLAALVRHLGRETDRGTSVDGALSAQDVADLSGTTIYSVSRVLSAWQRSGIIERGRGWIRVINLEALLQKQSNT
jgi:CRP-like cAMP-binding protein